MKLLIIAATKMEIAPSHHRLKSMGAELLISGIGAVPTAYCLTKAVQKLRPQLIIQAGIGGCFDSSVRLGEVLTIAEDGFGDMGVQEGTKWQSVFEMGFTNPDKKPYKNGVLKNPHKKWMNLTGLPAVPAITVNEITTQADRIRLLQSRGMVIESMEGAALHYVALMEKIPFIQIRAVSNYVGERNKMKWNFNDAIANLNQELVKIIDIVKNQTK